MICAAINPVQPPVAEKRLTDLISYSEYLSKTLQNLADALLLAKDAIPRDDVTGRINGMLNFCIGAYLDELDNFDAAVKKAKGEAA